MPRAEHAAGAGSQLDPVVGTHVLTHSTDKDIARDKEQYDCLPSVRMPGHERDDQAWTGRSPAGTVPGWAHVCEVINRKRST